MAFSGIVFAVLGSVFSLWAIVWSNWSSVTTWLYAPFRLVYVLACWRVALVGARKSPLVGTATFVRILAFIGSVCAGVLGAYSKSATCFVAAQAVESFGLVVALRTYGASGWLPFWEWSDLRGGLRLVAEPFTFREEPLGCGLSALLLGAFGSLWILSWVVANFLATSSTLVFFVAERYWRTAASRRSGSITAGLAIWVFSAAALSSTAYVGASWFLRGP